MNPRLRRQIMAIERTPRALGCSAAKAHRDCQYAEALVAAEMEADTVEGGVAGT